MHNFDTQYKRLNAAQKDAVDTIEGPVVVIAGPGTGKTQILTLRIASILKNAGAGIGPENILALTFTNAGVAAMRSRLATFIGAADAYRAHIFTFHGFCERQITDYPDYFPQIAFAQHVDDVERLSILTTIVRENAFVRLKTFSSDTHAIKDIAAAIDKIKSAGIAPDAFVTRVDAQQSAVEADPESYYKRKSKNGAKGTLKKDALKDVHKNRELAHVYAAYQEALRAAKLYDYNDMIVEVVRAIEKDEEFASMLREQYQYILVDEHQDTNDGQNRLLELLLASPHDDESPNIFTVGDDKQAIYRFQGASVENFHHFKKRFADTKVIQLDVNYRATQDLLDTAHTVITRDGADPAHQALTAHTNVAGHTRVLRYRTYGDEVRGIVEDIHAACESGVSPREIAVFCRKNEEVNEIAQMCEKMDVPYVIGGKHNVLHNPLIRIFVRLLSAVAVPTDDDRFAAVLVTPLSHVPMRDATVFLHRARTAPGHRTLYECATDTAWMVREMGDGGASISTFAQMLTALKEQSVTMPLVSFIERAARTSAWVAFLAAQRDHVVQFADMATLMEKIATIAQRYPAYTLDDVVAYFDTCETYGLAIEAGEPTDADGVQIMTAHAAKGLEFDHVYIGHAMHGTWDGARKNHKFKLPINTVTHDDDDDRRLFYVALTRARLSATVTYAQYDKNGTEASPTMFLEHVHVPVTDVTPQADARIDFAPRLRHIVSLTDATLIRNRFLTMPLSATVMNNYFQSPLVYFFRTLVHLPTVQSKSLLFGNVVHSTMEHFVRNAIAAGAIPSVEDMIAIFHERLRRNHMPRMYRDEFATRGEAVLRGYYAEHAATMPLVGSVEQRITGVPFVLDGGQEIMLTGTIDRITPTEDGHIVVTDYKTGKSWTDKKEKEQREGMERQMRFYKLLLDNDPRATHPPVVYGEISFIEPRIESGDYETKKITITDDDIRALKEEINVMARDVMSGAFLDTVVQIKDAQGNPEIAYYLRLFEEMKRSATQDVV